jgi:hypothetical protein
VTAKRRNRSPRDKRVDETLYLSGKRKGAVLKEEVWYEGDRVAKYSLAYINPKVFSGDNGRVLGFDNTHDYHHRHFMGKIEQVEFRSYADLVRRFERELYAQWETEDASETKR